MRDWLRSSLRRGRLAYLLALALPGVSLVFWLRNPYLPDEPFAWAWLGAIPVCIAQCFRPTLAGWALVVGTYSWSVFLDIREHIGAFEDLGSEDHGRWEGWGTELLLICMTAWLVLVLILLVARRPKRTADAA